MGNVLKCSVIKLCYNNEFRGENLKRIFKVVGIFYFLGWIKWGD